MITPEEAKAELKRRAMSKITPDQAKAELAKRGISPQASPVSMGDAAKQGAMAGISPFLASGQNPSMKLARGWQGLKPETQRSLGYLSSSIVMPEMMGMAAESMGAGLAAKTGLRALGGAGASILKDKATGAPISSPDAAITAGSEGLGGAAEFGAGKLEKYAPAMAKKFASISEPISAMAKKYGTRFSEKFPGTSEAINEGAGKMSKFYENVSGKVKAARDISFGKQSKIVADAEAKYASEVAAHEKKIQSMRDAFTEAKKAAVSDRDRRYIAATEQALQKHAEDIKGLSGQLSNAAQDYTKAGADLRSAGFRRGIKTDPLEELRQAKIGPAESGGKHKLAVTTNRLPSDIEPLEIRLKQYMGVEKSLPSTEKLKEVVHLKQAFQDLKHIQGGLNYAENEAVNAYLGYLDKQVKVLDPEYSVLEKTFHNTRQNYERLYDKSKKIFDELREGGEIPVPRDMIPKMADFKPQEVEPPNFPEAPSQPNIPSPAPIKPSAIERGPYGKTQGHTRDVLYRMMNPSDANMGKAAEMRQRVSNAPGAEQAMGNIASKTLRNPITRGMIYPMAFGVASAAGLPIALAKSGTGKRLAGGIGGTIAMAAFMRAAMQSPRLYEMILTNPDLLKLILSRGASTIPKAAVAATQ